MDFFILSWACFHVAVLIFQLSLHWKIILLNHQGLLSVFSLDSLSIFHFVLTGPLCFAWVLGMRARAYFSFSWLCLFHPVLPVCVHVWSPDMCAAVFEFIKLDFCVTFISSFPFWNYSVVFVFCGFSGGQTWVFVRLSQRTSSANSGHFFLVLGFHFSSNRCTFSSLKKKKTFTYIHWSFSYNMEQMLKSRKQGPFFKFSVTSFKFRNYFCDLTGSCYKVL